MFWGTKRKPHYAQKNSEKWHKFDKNQAIFRRTFLEFLQLKLDNWNSTARISRDMKARRLVKLSKFHSLIKRAAHRHTALMGFWWNLFSSSWAVLLKEEFGSSARRLTFPWKRVSFKEMENLPLGKAKALRRWYSPRKRVLRLNLAPIPLEKIASENNTSWAQGRCTHF